MSINFKHILLFLFLWFCSISYGQTTTGLENAFEEGDRLLKKGRYDEALSYFENELEKIVKNGNGSTIKAGLCYGKIGVVFWSTGNNSQAIEYHLKSLSILRKLLDESAIIIADTYYNLGLSYTRDDPEKALSYYYKALTIYKEKEGEASVADKLANGYINISIIQRQMREYTQSLQYLKKALTIKEAPTAKAFIFSVMGQVHEDMGDLDSSLHYQNKALALYQKSYPDSKHPEIANTYNLLSNVYNTQGDFTKALGMLKEAINANTNANGEPYYPDIMLVTKYQQAQILQNRFYNKSLNFKDLKKSLALLYACDSLIDNIRHIRESETDKIALGATAYEVYENAIKLCLSISEMSWKPNYYKQKAFYFAEKSKSSVLLEAITDMQAKSYANIPQIMLEKEKSLKEKIAYYKQALVNHPTKEAAVIYRDSLFHLTNEYEKFVINLEVAYPEYYDLKYNTTIVTVDEIQKSIDASTILLNYFIAEEENSVYVFYVSKKGLRVEKVKLPDNFEKVITEFRNAIFYDFKDLYLKTAFTLYKTLLPREPNKHIKKLILIPDTRLSNIPFEALLKEKPKHENEDFSTLKYLVLDYAISYHYSSSLSIQMMNKEEKTAKKYSAALFAPVSFKEQAQLPATEDEVNEIAAIFSNNMCENKLFIKREANESAFNSESLLKYNFVHLATHAEVNEDNPEESKILFNAEGIAEGNGHLHLSEIYALHIPAKLVALSACETGLGKIKKGEGLIGLTRAFLYAGANNLIVSQWSVADKSTSLLMIDFYSYFLSNKEEGFTKALQTAKKNMIEEKTFSNPYYWAPFILIGR